MKADHRKLGTLSVAWYAENRPQHIERFVKDCTSNVRAKRAGGAEFVSPALQRGEKGFQKFVPESRRDGARILFIQEPTASGVWFIFNLARNHLASEICD